MQASYVLLLLVITVQLPGRGWANMWGRCHPFYFACKLSTLACCVNWEYDRHVQDSEKCFCSPFPCLFSGTKSCGRYYRYRREDWYGMSPLHPPPQMLAEGREDVPSAREEDVPPAREEDMPSAREEDMPPAKEEDMPPAREEDMPSAREEDVPPAKEEDMPPAKEEDMPPAREDMAPLREEPLPTYEENWYTE